jgi:hypothetical protein
MKVYRVNGYDYDSSYEGNIYTKREHAEIEAEYLNKIHIMGRLRAELWEEMSCEEAELEKQAGVYGRWAHRGTLSFEEELIKEAIAHKIQKKYRFFYDSHDDCKDDPYMWVNVSELEIQDELPEEFRPTRTDIHTALTRAFQ